MIKTRNLGEMTFALKKAGSASVANDLDNICAPWAGYISAISASYGVMGTDGTGAPTQDVIADIKKNGTSIFSGATKLNFSHAKQVGTANTPIGADNIGALSADPTTVAKNDKIRIDVTQILNGTAPTQPTDLTVYITFARSRVSQKGTLKGQLADYND